MATTCKECGTRARGTEHITGTDALAQVFYPGKGRGTEQNVHTHPELESIAERAGVKALMLRFDPDTGDLAEVHCVEEGGE